MIKYYRIFYSEWSCQFLFLYKLLPQPLFYEAYLFVKSVDLNFPFKKSSKNGEYLFRQPSLVPPCKYIHGSLLTS